ncbi:MAG: polyketide synthase, partial [Betaproteobacteria bacterium]|nr:polyketide synthase [Betaproteobacteria bacterium]
RMDDVDALHSVVAILRRLEPEAQRRVLASAEAFLDVPPHRTAMADVHPDPTLRRRTGESSSSGDVALSANTFLDRKRPVSDVDRVACLAYYLTHYEKKAEFRIADLIAINDKAGQNAFYNVRSAIANAVTDGYLIVGISGTKRISATGDAYVDLLPNVQAARDALRAHSSGSLPKLTVPWLIHSSSST